MFILINGENLALRQGIKLAGFHPSGAGNRQDRASVEPSQMSRKRESHSATAASC
jgi:hypothetical protein